MSRPPRVVIAAGGTAGHVVPALTVADALRADGAEVHFVGGSRAEATLVPDAGYPLHRIDVVPLPRRSPVGALRAAATDAGAVGTVFRLLGQVGPDVVMGGGGYVAGPACVAARARRLPIVLTETDSHLGLTNRMLASHADRVCLALPIPHCEPPRFLVTGRPVPPITIDREEARARFEVPADRVCVLVFGGSQGARSINTAALAAFASGGPGAAMGSAVHVLHAAGERDLPALRETTTGREHYDLRGYISGLVDAIVASDVVVARSGGSIFEVAAAGRPSILIPYPHATADHQSANARYFADAGAAVVIPDAELTPARLAAELAELVGDPARRAAMGRAALTLARPAAAADIAAEVLAAAGLHRRRSARSAGPPGPAQNP